MKRGTKLLALLLVLALLSGGALVLSSLHLDDDTGNADEETAIAIYSAEQSSINRIAWTVGEKTHTLVIIQSHSFWTQMKIQSINAL